MKNVVFAGGEYTVLDFYKRVAQKCDFKVAADSGAELMRKIGIHPDLLVGDMDSISKKTLEFYEEKGVKILRFPTKKDEIDTELAVIQAEKNSGVVLIAGAFGNRLDQTLAVFRLVEKYSNVVLFNEKLYVLKVTKRVKLSSAPGETWSILPLRNDALGVSLRGFEYTLEKKVMEYLRPYGISNVSLGNEVEVDPGNGTLLVFRYHDGKTTWIEELSKMFKAR